MVQLKKIGPIAFFENFKFNKRERIFERLQRSVTLLAETRTFLAPPNFPMAHFEARNHSAIVKTPKNEDMKGNKFVTAPRSQVITKNSKIVILTFIICTFMNSKLQHSNFNV